MDNTRRNEILLDGKKLMLVLMSGYFFWHVSYPFFSESFRFWGLHDSMDELITVLLAGILVKKIFNNNMRITVGFVEIGFAFIFFLTFLSATINGVPYKNIPLFILVIGKPLVIYMAIKYCLINRNMLDFLIRILWVGFWINFPFILYTLIKIKFQFYIFHDVVLGIPLFGNVHNLFYIYIFLFAQQYLVYLKEKRLKTGCLLLLLGFLMITTMNTKALALTIPILGGLFLFDFDRRMFFRLIPIMGVVFAIGFLFVWPIMNKYFYSAQFSPVVNANLAIFKELPDEIPYPIFGAGPGMHSSSIATKDKTPLAQKYVLSWYEIYKLGVKSGVMQNRSNSFTVLYGEGGPFMFFTYLLIYVMIFFHALRRYNSGQKTLPVLICFIFGTYVMAIGLLNHSYYWFINNYIFWVAAAYLLADREKIEAISTPV